MAYVGMIVGVLWVIVLALVFAVCRAAGRADRQEEAAHGMLAAAGPSAAHARRSPRRARGRGGRALTQEAAPDIAVAAAAGAGLLSR